jgi:hypothetical protein
MSPTVKAIVVGAVAAGASHFLVEKFINPAVGKWMPLGQYNGLALTAITGAALAVGLSKAL